MRVKRLANVLSRHSLDESNLVTSVWNPETWLFVGPGVSLKFAFKSSKPTLNLFFPISQLCSHLD